MLEELTCNILSSERDDDYKLTGSDRLQCATGTPDEMNY